MFYGLCALNQAIRQYSFYKIRIAMWVHDTGNQSLIHGNLSNYSAYPM